jgi:hypothetical protein
VLKSAADYFGGFKSAAELRALQRLAEECFIMLESALECRKIRWTTAELLSALEASGAL